MSAVMRFTFASKPVSKLVTKLFFFIFSAVLLSACAHTSIEDSWKEPDHDQSYSKPLVIGISDSQQNRQIFEKQFAEKLNQYKTEAVPSYTLISSKQKINRETVVDAIKGTGIDAVLVTYLVSAEYEMKYHDSPINTGYSGSSETNMMSSTIISKRGRSRSEEIISLKTDLFDVGRKQLVWSAQTETVGPESIDHTIIEVTDLLVEQLLDDGVIKK
jgi:hypothetical protein